MSGVNDNATMLAEHLHSQAKWRESKAEEYPDDDRNERASDALTDAGNEVAAMSDDDPRLRKMSGAGWFEEGLCTPGEHGRRSCADTGSGPGPWATCWPIWQVQRHVRRRNGSARRSTSSSPTRSSATASCLLGH